MRSHLRSLLGGLRIVTPFGWTVGALTVIAWSAAAWLGWREFAVMAGAGLVLMIIAVVSTLGKLDLSSELKVEPARVVVGERAAGSMIMTNQSSRHSRAVRVELPVGKSSALFAIPRLAPGGMHDELFIVPTSKRAVIPVGPVTTVQGDPLGLVRRTKTWSERYEIFVHPVTTLLETMVAGLVRDLEGQTTNHLTNSDIAFHTLRDYVPGDDRRHVHWKSTAKLGKLMVRQYVDTRRSHVCVLLSTDAAEYQNDDEFELAVSCIASVALQATRDEQTLTVIVGGEQWSAANPKGLLDHFSRVEMTTGGGNADACFATARRVAPEASVTSLGIGSAPSVAHVRRAASRAPLETKVVIVQCATEGTNGYKMIGSTRFVQVANLGALRRGLAAVL